MKQAGTRAVGAAARRGKGMVRRGLRLVAAPTSPVRRALPQPVVAQLRVVRRHLPTRLVRLVDAAAGAGPASAVSRQAFARGSRRPSVPDTPVRVWIAPANFAGQGRLWARSIDRNLAGVGARSMAVEAAIRFDVDQSVDPDVYRDTQWQRDQERHVLDNYTHVLVEAERPLFGTRYGRTCEIEIARLREAGKQVALISHGSDLRIPSEHAARFAHSPFVDADDRTTTILEARARQNARIIAEFDGPVFVSTPDLVDYAPTARWCPTVVNPEIWASDWPLLRRDRPRVVHVPSNGPLKGTEHIDRAMTELHDAGLVDYRTLRNLTHDELRREYQEADVVVDQVVLGLYGVASVEAMAAGRVVVAFVGDDVRRRVREATGREVPVLEATVETIRDVVEGIVRDRDEARRFAAGGPEYVRAVHDGHYSARVLSEFTGGELRDPADVPPWSPPSGLPERPAPEPEPSRLLVGPANFAGQAHAWARAADALPGVSARSMGTANPVFTFPSDYEVEPHNLESGPWTARQERYVHEYYTHVLAESLRPLSGKRYGRHADGEISRWRDAGPAYAILAHGSDVRVPSVHRTTTAFSPFSDETWDAVRVLEAQATRNVAAVATAREHGVPCFVSTLDLLDYLPDARWCPVVVDVARWASDAPLLERDRPVVVHVPSNARMKGSELIEEPMQRLAASGLVAYRHVEGVPSERMPALYGEADVVLDQFVLGSYGVAACEAMAAGRVVVGHVTDAVRERVRAETGLELPIVEANPDTVADVVAGLVADRGRAREYGVAGREFVRSVHDGRRSAEALATWLAQG